MRTLAAAWADEAVDSQAACWLTSEVLKTGSDESKAEAASLLDRNSDRLATSVRGTYYWPASIYERWPGKFPIDARVSILFAIPKVLLSRPRAWWTGNEGLVLGHS